MFILTNFHVVDFKTTLLCDFIHHSLERNLDISFQIPLTVFSLPKDVVILIVDRDSAICMPYSVLHDAIYSTLCDTIRRVHATQK